MEGQAKEDVMEGQAKEDVDDDMFSKTSSNFSGMVAHTLEYGALLRIFFYLYRLYIFWYC